MSRMFGISKPWLIIGGAAFALLSGVMVLFFAYAGTITRREVYVYANPNWVAETIETAKLVRLHPNPKCDINLDGIAETVAELFGAAITDPLPRDQSHFAIVALCGLRQSTFYYLPATIEVWINYCDLRVSSGCLANKVFAFTHAFGPADWPCVREVMRQELVNYKQRHVRRVVGTNCQ